MSSREKPTEPLRPAESLETVAARCQESGATHDRATLQLLREILWENLSQTREAECAEKILLLIIAARRQLLAETAEENKRALSQQRLDLILDEVIDPELRLPPPERISDPPAHKVEID